MGGFHTTAGQADANGKGARPDDGRLGPVETTVVQAPGSSGLRNAGATPMSVEIEGLLPPKWIIVAGQHTGTEGPVPVLMDAIVNYPAA